tara:strand:- start:32962 stop:35007 length:2046 start_codon:yes stop_codon:yes gene_type:complete
MNKECKIVMVAMFKNEAPVLRKMLDSVLGYIDYYVIQDNGSTDGSPDIVKDWAKENNIPGVLYEVKEGWKGFGWNRDHLIRYCQNEVDHGCDWILKMDCDETLEVYDDFDWSVFNDKTIHGFNIPAVSGTGVYYRTWLWNNDLQWAFNHDPCHETIYCLDPEIDHNYNAYPLPLGFNQIGSNDGMSWAVPTKFISDALRLEEKLIREQNLLENMYHFWYIGKSYRDAMESSAFPLKKKQADEYARRSIWYLNEYINQTMKNKKGNIGIDEMCYMAGIMAGECYNFMGKKKEAITAYSMLQQFAPGRNDHLWQMVHLYQETKQYKKMLDTTTIMMDPERTFPFPQYCNFIDKKHYVDGTGDVQSLYKEAQRLNEMYPEEESTDWEMYFDSIIDLCPWAKSYWKQGKIDVQNWDGTKNVTPLGDYIARIWISKDSDLDYLHQICKRINIERLNEEWLFSHPDVKNRASPKPILIQQDTETLNQARNSKKDVTYFAVNKIPTKRVWVVDNFYERPDELRDWALTSLNFQEDSRWYKGFRSEEKYRPIDLKYRFENIIGEKIVDWDGGMNGVFQVTRAQDPQVWHFDEQRWAAMIYLSPNAPYESGTRLHISKINKAKHSIEDADIIDDAFDGNFLDSTRFHTLDTVGNLFNRLAIFDARHIHSAGEYFGKDLHDSRLTHLFFFD